MRKLLLLTLVLVFSFQVNSKTNDSCAIFNLTDYHCVIDGKDIKVNSEKEDIMSDSRIKKGVTLIFYLHAGVEYSRAQHFDMLITIAAICDFNKQMLETSSPFKNEENSPGELIYCSRV